MRQVIVRVHLQRALEKTRGKLRVAFLKLHLPEQDVRPREVLVEPNGLLQDPLGLIPFLLPRVRIAHAPVSEPQDGIDLEFFVEFVERTLDVGLEKENFSQEEMGHRKSGLERKGLFELRDGFVFEFLAEHHLPEDQVGLSGFRRHGEHFRKSSSGPVEIVGLKITDSEHVGTGDVRAGQPGLDLFEERYGLWQTAQGIARKPEQLRGLAVLRPLLERQLQMLDRLLVVALLVVKLAESGLDTRSLWILGGQIVQKGNGLVRLAFSEERVGAGHVRGLRTGLDRNGPACSARGRQSQRDHARLTQRHRYDSSLLDQAPGGFDPVISESATCQHVTPEVRWDCSQSSLRLLGGMNISRRCVAFILRTRLAQKPGVIELGSRSQVLGITLRRALRNRAPDGLDFVVAQAAYPQKISQAGLRLPGRHATGLDRA